MFIVHGKVTVTAVSVQSLRNARISRELAHAIASSSGQQSAQPENSFYRLQRSAWPEQPASPLQVAGSCCIAGRPLRPEIQPTNIVVMLQVRYCSLLRPCQKITNV